MSETDAEIEGGAAYMARLDGHKWKELPETSPWWWPWLPSKENYRDDWIEAGEYLDDLDEEFDDAMDEADDVERGFGKS